MNRKGRLIHCVVGASSTSDSCITSCILRDKQRRGYLFLCLSFFFLIAVPVWATDGSCKKSLGSDEAAAELLPHAAKSFTPDSNAKSRARYVEEYNQNPDRLSVAEEIPELNTVRVRLKGERFHQPKDGLPPVYVIFYHGAGTGKAGPHSSEQNLIDMLSPTPGRKGSTQARVQSLPNYVLMGGEAVALPSSKAGPARSDYENISEVSEFIRAHVEYVRRELPAGTRIIAAPRSSSPHLLVHAMVQNPGLFDGLYAMSANVGGTKPEDIARIAEGTAALKRDLKKQGRENDLDEGGLAWIDSLLAQFDWIPEQVIERLPPSSFATSALDDQTLRSDRVTQLGIAASSQGKIQFIDYQDGAHNVLETSADALPDFFSLVARVRGDTRAQAQLVADLAQLNSNKHSGLGIRGFFGASPKPTDENLIASIPMGVMHWSVALRPVKKGEAGIAEARRSLDIPGVAANKIHRPLFITSSNKQLEQVTATLRKLTFEAMQMNQKAEADPAFKSTPEYRGPEYYSEQVKKIIASEKVPAVMAKVFEDTDLQIFELDADGNPVYFTPEQIAQFFDPNHIKIGWEKNGALGVLKASGWTYPKERGVLTVERGKQASGYTKGTKHWKKLEALGYTMKRNQDFWGILEGLKNQDRVGKTAAENRYTDPEYLKQVQLAYQKGMIDTVEFYDENGKLVGGSIAFKIGNTYSFDSVYYPDRKKYAATHKVDGIEFQRMIIARTLDIMEEEGLPVADVQMVSNLTAQFGAEYIPVAEFERLVLGATTP